MCRVLYCCTKFQKICSSLSGSKRCANSIFLAKLALYRFNLCIYLHTTPKGHLIKLNLHRTHKGHFSRKTVLIEKNIRSYDVLNGLNSIKFLEIFNINKTPNILSTNELKITFKPLNFARN